MYEQDLNPPDYKLQSNINDVIVSIIYDEPDPDGNGRDVWFQWLSDFHVQKQLVIIAAENYGRKGHEETTRLLQKAISQQLAG